MPHCNTQHTATCCNMLHTATHCALQHTATHDPSFSMHMNTMRDATLQKVTHCNTLQRTATHCNTLQHAATHCTLQHTIPHSERKETRCAMPHRNNTATHCKLQHTATHCTLQNTATRYPSFRTHRNTMRDAPSQQEI